MVHSHYDLAEDTARSPEELLAFAVIAQAVKDARQVVRIDEDGKKSTTITCLTVLDIDCAKRFLTAPSGEMARSREFWATVAGVDPDWLRDKSIAVLNTARVSPEEDVAIAS